MSDCLEILKDNGMTNSEAKIYLALLQLSECTAGEIAKETRFFRKNVYDSLEKLSAKGFVTHNIQRGKKYWKPTDPERIKSITEQKLLNLNQILPELKSKYKQKKSDRIIEVYEGLEGVKAWNDLMIKKAKIIYNIGASNQMFEKLKYFTPYLAREGVKRKIKGKYLFNHDTKKVQELEKYPEFEYRFLPKNFRTATQIILFADYSCIFIWLENPLSILIKSQEINKGFMNYFNFLWSISKERK